VVRNHATWGLTPAVFRLVPVRLKWLYWAIFDPAFPQCLHFQYRWHIRLYEQQYAASTVLTLFNDISWSRPAAPSQLQLGASPHLLRHVTWPPLVSRLRACLGWICIQAADSYEMPAEQLSDRSTPAEYAAENRSVFYGSLPTPGRGYCTLFLALPAPGPRHPPLAAPKKPEQSKDREMITCSAPLPSPSASPPSVMATGAERAVGAKEAVEPNGASEERTVRQKKGSRGKRGSKGERAVGRKEAVGE